MKLIEFLKEKIMARPKGSKNKATETPAPREFDYERDDTAYDGTYQVSTTTSFTAAPETPWTLTEPVVTGAVGASDTVIAPIAKVHPGQNLYLVEGDVQLSSRNPGQGSMVAKQTRLVRASNEIQAVEKYSNYFRGLSDVDSVYMVVRAAAMETIV